MARPVLVAKKAVADAGGTTDLVVSLTSGWNTTYGSATYAPADNDFIIVSRVVGTLDVDQTIGITAPSGSYTTRADLYQNDSGDCNLHVATKFAVASTDTEVTIAATGANGNEGAYEIELYSGVDTTTPMDVAVQTAGGINGGQPNPPSITPTTTDTIVVVIGGAAVLTGMVAFTQSGSELSNFLSVAQTGGTEVAIGSGSFNWTSGAFDPVAWTGGSTGSGACWNAVCLALRPTAGTAIQAGMATETDTSLQAGALAHGVNLSAETDTSLKAGGIGLKVNLSAETDTALALAVGTLGVGVAVETDVAFTLGQVFIIPVGGRLPVENPTFSTDTIWSKGTNVTISGGVANFAATPSGQTVIQVFSNLLSSPNRFRLSYDIVSYSAGGFASRFESQTGPTQTVPGTYTDEFDSIGGTENVGVRAISTTTGSVDNIFLVQITQEIDAALALNPVVVPTWTQSNETDSAFSRVAGFPVVFSNETDTALKAGGVGLRVNQAAETDTSLKAGGIGLRVNKGLETDTAIVRGLATPAKRANEIDAALYDPIRLPGVAVETDTAFKMFGTLVSGSNRKPYIDLKQLLQERRQPIYIAHK